MDRGTITQMLQLPRSRWRPRHALPAARHRGAALRVDTSILLLGKRLHSMPLLLLLPYLVVGGVEELFRGGSQNATQTGVALLRHIHAPRRRWRQRSGHNRLLAVCFLFQTGR